MTIQRNRRVLLLALLLASISAVAAFLLISSRPDAVPAVVQAAPPAGEPVLVGARSIAVGEVLTGDDIEVAYVAPETKASRVLTESAQAIGEVALVAIPKGEQILAGSVGVSAAPAENTFARNVPLGMRAVTIASEETVGVGGFVLPGDRVDVIAGFELKPAVPGDTVEKRLGLGGSDELESESDGEPTNTGTPVSGDDAEESSEADDESFPMAELLLQDVEVLAIGQELDGAAAAAAAPDSEADTAPEDEGAAGRTSRAEAASVTLLVSPAQALRLLLAVQADGVFRLLLRAPGDTTVTELPPALITSGAMPMAPIQLVGANLIGKDLVITDARFRETSLPAGGTLEFEATVRNISSRFIPAGRGGAEPGHIYLTGQSWQSLEDGSPAGVYSLGITSDTADSQSYPWRWDLGEDLAPGQTATITGGIQVPNVPGVQRWWFGTLLQPGTVLEDGVASVEITIEPVASVVVIAGESDLLESPWPNAASVLKVPQGTRADVLDYQDGWFLIRSGTSEGWVLESTVANAVLPEAAAAGTPVPSS